MSSSLLMAGPQTRPVSARPEDGGTGKGFYGPGGFWKPEPAQKDVGSTRGTPSLSQEKLGDSSLIDAHAHADPSPSQLPSLLSSPHGAMMGTSSFLPSPEAQHTFYAPSRLRVLGQPSSTFSVGEPTPPADLDGASAIPPGARSGADRGTHQAAQVFVGFPVGAPHPWRSPSPEAPGSRSPFNLTLMGNLVSSLRNGFSGTPKNDESQGSQ